MCIQWGLCSQPQATQRNVVSFHITYTKKPIVNVTTRGTNDTDYYISMLGYTQPTLTGFEVDSNVGTATKVRIMWIAIGY